MIKRQLIIIMLSLSVSIQTHALTSVNLISESAIAAMKTSGNCLRYKIPTRACIWASPVAGRNLTPYLDHYLPDLVVVVYRNHDENPWVEAKALIDSLPAAAQKKFLPQVGSGNHDFISALDQQVIFKEADVIGNPGVALHVPYALLPSAATPLRPYFQSMMDSALWRGFMPQAGLEEAESIVLGSLHKVGRGLTDWGGVYPHEGTVQGNNDAKASMVIAQRATDLISNASTFGHVHDSLSNYCGQHCTAAPIKENSQDTLFQMVYPISESACITFGNEETFKNNMVSQDGAYVWIVWRHYKGCPDGDGIFIGVTP